MIETLETIKNEKIIAIIREDSQDRAFNAAVACIEGGIRIVEITLNTEGALEIICALRDNYPYILTGAGTVLNTDMAREAISSGAKFIVSPHTDREIIEYAHLRNIRCAISTNGTLITQKIAHSLKEAGIIYVGVSIDGDRETTDYFRGDGTYNKVMENVKWLRKIKYQLKFKSRINFFNIRMII